MQGMRISFSVEQRLHCYLRALPLVAVKTRTMLLLTHFSLLHSLPVFSRSPPPPQTPSTRPNHLDENRLCTLLPILHSLVSVSLVASHPWQSAYLVFERNNPLCFKLNFKPHLICSCLKPPPFNPIIMFCINTQITLKIHHREGSDKKPKST